MTIQQTIQSLISDIDTFAAEFNVVPATVCSRAVNNSRLYARLEKPGGYCSPDVEKRLRDYMDAARAKKAGAAA